MTPASWGNWAPASLFWSQAPLFSGVGAGVGAWVRWQVGPVSGEQRPRAHWTLML